MKCNFNNTLSKTILFSSPYMKTGYLNIVYKVSIKHIVTSGNTPVLYKSHRGTQPSNAERLRVDSNSQI